MGKNTGGPAFPVAYEHDGGEVTMESHGMTLRDWFAGKADAEVYRPLDTFVHRYSRQPTVDEMAEYIASIRYAYADAMIAARESE